MTEETPASLWPDDRHIGNHDGPMFEMPSRHRYLITGSLLATRPDIAKTGRVEMTRHILDTAPSALPVVFSTHNIDQILARRRVPMAEKARLVMREIVSALGGRPGRLTVEDGSPWLYETIRRAQLNLGDEIKWLLQYLVSLGRIEQSQYSGGTTITLPVHGLIDFEAENEHTSSRNAFVAMWFGEEVSTVYDNAIVPAISGWGYDPIRIDKREHNNKIDDEIVSEIRRAKFVVADFSCGPDGARGGVYYEAGFATGLGKPVIFTVRSTDLARVHFDTRQFNHIVWETEEELRVALENRIGATIGEYRP